MPDDEWNEYRLECATRQRLQLPDVSLVEFADMRDWTDGVEETDDDYEYHDYEYRSEPDPLPPECSPH